jgi:hypothetical protein
MKLSHRVALFVVLFVLAFSYFRSARAAEPSNVLFVNGAVKLVPTATRLDFTEHAMPDGAIMSPNPLSGLVVYEAHPNWLTMWHLDLVVLTHFDVQMVTLYGYASKADCIAAMKNHPDQEAHDVLETYLCEPPIISRK